ncbi:hypothetical protein [Runella slithyformis]|uniref:Uncharacterized protein n=1 Tax=Runella slithyformis (strain ATCC 29530 / DSM 19594 / LMG 11500 / NCIMB 11436 / LSU 4) TaxID=761193 RepID=A0A7U3ZI78_RUNSL|nr:hypothetical protein [Runella slithyformis]AEI47663.1 hypothetical protein Runsl_1236 [Runella slithyformis DSM 19594]
MTEQITTRPTRIHRTDYRQLGLIFGAAFLGTLLALGLLMLFGKMLVKRQIKDLEKLGEPEPTPKMNQPKPKAPVIIEEIDQIDSEWQVITNVAEINPETSELPISQELADTNEAKKRERGENGKFIKRQPIIINS